MKNIYKILFTGALSSLLFITGCNKNNTNNDYTQDKKDDNKENVPSDDLNKERYTDEEINRLKEEYGKLQISREDGGNVNYTFNESKNEYRIKVEETKARYIISGYTEAHFIITNDDNLTTHKGIKIKLNKACIVSKNEYVPIYYSLQTKNVEISAKNETSNKIITLNGSNGIDSENNVEIGGNGNLEIFTKKTNDYGNNGHCIKSSNKVLLYDSVNLNLFSAHDGIHCDDFIALNEEDNNIYSGIANFNNIASQAIEATTKKCGGEINLAGGKFIINNANNVFKVDSKLIIKENCEVVATNIKENPIIKQTKEEVESNITIPVLDVIVEGRFTSNGNNMTSKKM